MFLINYLLNDDFSRLFLSFSVSVNIVEQAARFVKNVVKPLVSSLLSTVGTELLMMVPEYVVLFLDFP